MNFIQVDEKNRTVTVRVNTKVFPVDLVYEAAYLVLDRAYVVLDGDPEKEVFAILSPRTFKGELPELGRIFFDELVAAAFNAVQFMKSRELREALMESLGVSSDDEEDIATLWEEKFGGAGEIAAEEGK